MANRTNSRSVVDEIEPPGSGSESRPNNGRAGVKRVEASSSSMVVPRKPTKGRSKRARAAGETPTPDRSKRTIGERITALREEAESLALDLQEPDDEPEDEEDEDREADTEAALGLLEVLEGVEDPSPSVAALVVEYRPRPEWSPLDRAKDLRDELELIGEVFRASGIEDEGFDACLEELHGWMYEF